MTAAVNVLLFVRYGYSK